jgi:hypothetical protein
MKTAQEITNNVCFEYGNLMIVSSSVEEVKNWINSLPGLTCNEPTENNLKLILNTEWQVWGYYKQNISPINKDGFRLEHLKTTGIGTGKIRFSLTKCNSVEEVLAERAAYAKRIEEAKAKVAEIKNTIGTQLLEKLSKKSKSCVDMFHNGALEFVLRIGENGYWINDRLCPHYHYINEYYTHFDADTLITDEGLNVFEVLNRFLDEN